MNRSNWVDDFINLGENLTRFLEKPDENLLIKISEVNPWFIRSYVLNALTGILKYLHPGNINNWLSNYNIKRIKVKNIGIIMAGNVPLAGFHDLLCVLITGNNAIIRPSHSDTLLIELIITELQNINPFMRNRIILRTDLSGVDAIIATGSDNSARYFKYYFNSIPKLIRANRSSCCIIDGLETLDEVTALSDDVFLYFGLGCRNVTKIYLPVKSGLHSLIKGFSKYSWITEHKKYLNNYMHNRSLASLRFQSFTDSGYFLFVENNSIVSPVGMIYYETYSDHNDLKIKLAAHQNKIQCIVCHSEILPQSVRFGEAQFPHLWDYSDGIDTLDFLNNL
jgi:hypothetical protein